MKKCEIVECNNDSTHKVIWNDSLGKEEWFFCENHMQAVKIYLSETRKIEKIEISENK